MATYSLSGGNLTRSVGGATTKASGLLKTSPTGYTIKKKQVFDTEKYKAFASQKKIEAELKKRETEERIKAFKRLRGKQQSREELARRKQLIGRERVTVKQPSQLTQKRTAPIIEKYKTDVSNIGVQAKKDIQETTKTEFKKYNTQIEKINKELKEYKPMKEVKVFESTYFYNDPQAEQKFQQISFAAGKQYEKELKEYTQDKKQTASFKGVEPLLPFGSGVVAEGYQVINGKVLPKGQQTQIDTTRFVDDWNKMNEIERVVRQGNVYAGIAQGKDVKDLLEGNRVPVGQNLRLAGIVGDTTQNESPWQTFDRTGDWLGKYSFQLEGSKRQLDESKNLNPLEYVGYSFVQGVIGSAVGTGLLAQDIAFGGGQKTIAGVGRIASDPIGFGGMIVGEAVKNPARFTGELFGDYAITAGAGKAVRIVGKAGSKAGKQVIRKGLSTFDLGDVTKKSVATAFKEKGQAIFPQFRGTQSQLIESFYSSASVKRVKGALGFGDDYAFGFSSAPKSIDNFLDRVRGKAVIKGAKAKSEYPAVFVAPDLSTGRLRDLFGQYQIKTKFSILPKRGQGIPEPVVMGYVTKNVVGSGKGNIIQLTKKAGLDLTQFGDDFLKGVSKKASLGKRTPQIDTLRKWFGDDAVNRALVTPKYPKNTIVITPQFAKGLSSEAEGIIFGEFKRTATKGVRGKLLGYSNVIDTGFGKVPFIIYSSDDVVSKGFRNVFSKVDDFFLTRKISKATKFYDELSRYGYITKYETPFRSGSYGSVLLPALTSSYVFPQRKSSAVGSGYKSNRTLSFAGSLATSSFNRTFSYPKGSSGISYPKISGSSLPYPSYSGGSSPSVSFSGITYPKSSSGSGSSKGGISYPYYNSISGTSGSYLRTRTQTMIGVPSKDRRKEKSMLKDDRTQLFVPFVRRNNNSKWVKASKQAYPKNRAYNVGFQVADNSTAVSVKLEPRGRARQYIPDDFGLNAYKFKERGKRSRVPGKPPVFQEQNNYRIDTVGEKQQLSAARYVKQFMTPFGKKKKNWNWF